MALSLTCWVRLFQILFVTKLTGPGFNTIKDWPHNKSLRQHSCPMQSIGTKCCETTMEIRVERLPVTMMRRTAWNKGTMAKGWYKVLYNWRVISFQSQVRRRMSVRKALMAMGGKCRNLWAVDSVGAKRTITYRYWSARSARKDSLESTWLLS